jgi:hypothetical protein
MPFGSPGWYFESNLMKKKKTAKRKTSATACEVPDWVLDDPAVPTHPLRKQDLDELASGVESGMRDTAAWKELVRRAGKKEAARILKVALFSQVAIQPEPNTERRIPTLPQLYE